MPRIGEVVIGFAIAAAVGMVVAAFLFVRDQEAETEITSLSEPISQVFDTADTPAITVESWRGSVTVSAVQRPEVAVEIFRIGTGETEPEAFDNLTLLESRILQDGDTVTARTFRTNDAPAPAGTRAPITISAPAGASLNITATGPEPVIIQGITGAITIVAEGAVQIEVPAGHPFTLRAQTNGGAISNFVDLGAQPTSAGSGQLLEGSRGSGGSTITIEAGGAITIREG